jgi:hypothetical protein
MKVEWKSDNAMTIGTPQELDTLLAEGLASQQLGEDEFWTSLNQETDALLDERKTGRRP